MSQSKIELNSCFDSATSIKSKVLCTEKFNDKIYEKCGLSHDKANKETDEVLTRIFKKRKFNKEKSNGRKKIIQTDKQNARNKGFWDRQCNIPEKLCLIHAEVSEALEDYRDGNDDHFGEELADIVIRVADLAVHLDIDLLDEIVKKHNKNLARPIMHGGKRC